MKIVNIEAVDIPDFWFQAISNLLDYGYKYVVQKGSFEGETRLEFDYLVGYIKHPYTQPYDLMLPQIPHHLGIPNPVANGYIEDYLPYLMTDIVKDGEEYTYGQRLVNSYVPGNLLKFSCNIDQIKHFIKILKETPNTNQAILQIAQPSDCLLSDPPCLRSIKLRIKDNQLIVYPYFRSNDLFSGTPANLAAIAVLQKYLADEIGVESGPMIYSSDGAHIYGYTEQLARLRCYKEK